MCSHQSTDNFRGGTGACSATAALTSPQQEGAVHAGWLRLFRRRSRSRGFSFVEMAVSIFIIGAGLLITLRGTALVDTFKALLTAIEIDQLRSTLTFYEEENHYLPGDDPQALERTRRSRAVTRSYGYLDDFTADGVVNGRFTDAANVEGEQFVAWRDLRSADLWDGDPALVGSSAMPENMFGGVIGFHEAPLGLRQGICFTQVPGQAAEMIDSYMDDGLIAQGEVRASSRFADTEDPLSGPPPDAAPYDVEKTYVLCVLYAA